LDRLHSIRGFIGVRGRNFSFLAAANHLHVSRATLSRILNGKADISSDMSLRLSATFRTHAEIWHELQIDCDMSQASKEKQPKIESFRRAA
jgi:addiction module HigA family antidote